MSTLVVAFNCRLHKADADTEGKLAIQEWRTNKVWLADNTIRWVRHNSVRKEREGLLLTHWLTTAVCWLAPFRVGLPLINVCVCVALHRFSVFLFVPHLWLTKPLSPFLCTSLTPGRPDPVRSCAITNHSMSTLLVECAAGDDGGLRQQFSLEVFAATTQQRVDNQTNSTPNFLVNRLTPGTQYSLVLYAFNAKGRSHSVSLSAVTLSPPEKHMSSRGTCPSPNRCLRPMDAHNKKG